MKNIKLNIDRSKIIGVMPENFFGHFIEYMHDCIEPGLLAQLLKSRSFENLEKDYFLLSHGNVLAKIQNVSWMIRLFMHLHILYIY